MKIIFYSGKTKQEYVIIPICANYVFYRNGFISHHHIHPVYHLVFVLQGQGYLESDDSKYLLKEKDIFVVNPKEKHIYGSNHNDGMMHFTVNFYLLQMDKFKSFDDGSFDAKSFDIKKVESLAETLNLDDIFDFKADNIFVEYDKSMWGSILTLTSTLVNRVEKITKNPFYILSGDNTLGPMLFLNYYSRFIIDLFNLISSFDTKYSNNHIQNDDILLNSIISYLNDNMFDRYDLSDLARCLNYSPVYLCTYFKQKTGMTITQYLNKLKINKASELLRRTDKTITEIASNLNYSSSNHFSNNFKKEKGISPKNYRSHPDLP